MYLKFKKNNINTITPNRNNRSDAGIDVFYCPISTKLDSEKKFIYDSDQTIELKPGKNYKFQTGLSFEIPHGYVLLVCNRSGIASKLNLVKGAEVIDAGYSGEIMIDLHNIGNESIYIAPETKIAQLLLLPCISVDLIEDDNIYSNNIVFSDREDKGWGSSK